MKHYTTWISAGLIVIVICCYPLCLSADERHTTPVKHTRKQTEQLIQEHLPQTAIAFPARHRARIQRLIVEQIELGRKETETTLGRAKLYFPVFEYFLGAYNLPDEFKYIPFVESRLRTQARSTAGAAGLWQFMEATGRQYQLIVNDFTDERQNPVKSTEAAAQFLSDLLERFDDSMLAIAAFNCGPGTVQRAIRKAGSRDYWDVERYLPQQTQRYMPTLIAAMYVVQFSELHGLSPKPYLPDNQDITVLRMRTALQCHEVAKLGALPLHIVKKLNPGYPQSPAASSRGTHYLLLPSPAAKILQRQMPQQVLESIPMTPAAEQADSIPETPIIETAHIGQLQRWFYLQIGGAQPSEKLCADAVS